MFINYIYNTASKPVMRNEGAAAPWDAVRSFKGETKLMKVIS